MRKLMAVFARSHRETRLIAAAIAINRRRRGGRVRVPAPAVQRPRRECGPNAEKQYLFLQVFEFQRKRQLKVEVGSDFRIRNFCQFSKVS